MPKVLNKNGVKHFWEIIKAHLSLKADKEDVDTLKYQINNLEFLKTNKIEIYGGSASSNL